LQYQYRYRYWGSMQISTGTYNSGACAVHTWTTYKSTRASKAPLLQIQSDFQVYPILTVCFIDFNSEYYLMNLWFRFFFLTTFITIKIRVSFERILVPVQI
jgi:hypothetical protein